MKIRGIEVSKVAEIVIDHKYFWRKVDCLWERDILVSGLLVKTEFRTQTDMVAYLNDRYFHNPRYKVWISPFGVIQDHTDMPGAHNTLNILKNPPAPPRKPNPNSRTQINKMRYRTLSADLKGAMFDLLSAFWGDAPIKEHECKCSSDDACRYDPNLPKIQVYPPKED